jgi:cystathionine beta-lyase
VSFDDMPSRDGTYSYKWEKYKGKDILPSWIADTEFACAPEILSALKERTNQSVLGYTLPQHYTPAVDAVIHWCNSQYDWQIQSDWIVWTPGVVPAFNMACKAYCDAGDSVIIQTPNYPPLLAAPKLNGLKAEHLVCRIVDGRYTIDFDELETLAAKPTCKLFILCNPMNPVGSVFSENELKKIASICAQHGVVVCSDEIHCDLILDGSQHIPAGKLDDIADASITLMAASKTFNVAGLGTSFAIIPDAKTRQRFVRAGAGIVPWPNILGLVAVDVAFTQCNEWRQDLLDYLRGNRDFLVNEINKIDGLRTISPQATFLLWVDGRELQQKDTQAWCENKGVGPSPGRDFGDNQFFRLNFGCSRAMLQQIVERLKS